MMSNAGRVGAELTLELLRHTEYRHLTSLFLYTDYVVGLTKLHLYLIVVALTSPPKNAKWYDNTHSAAVTVSTNKGGSLLGQDKEQGG